MIYTSDRLWASVYGSIDVRIERTRRYLPCKKDLGEGKSDFGETVERRAIMNGISPVSDDEKQRQGDFILNVNEFNSYLNCLSTICIFGQDDRENSKEKEEVCDDRLKPHDFMSNVMIFLDNNSYHCCVESSETKEIKEVSGSS